MEDDDLPIPDLPLEGLSGVPPRIEQKSSPSSAPEALPPSDFSPGGRLLPPIQGEPLLELETDGGSDTFAVYLLGFLRGQDEAGPKIAQMFGLDQTTAESLVNNTPIAVKRGASRETATAIERGLRSIGADVDVRPEQEPKRASRRPDPRSGATARAQAAIQAQNSAVSAGAAMGIPMEAASVIAHAPPRALRSGPPPRPVAQMMGDDHPGFWARLPMAFVVPFLGTGILWLLGLMMMLFVFVFSRMAPCIGLLMMPLFASVWLGLLGIYFGQAAQAGVEDDGSRPQPRWSMPSQGEFLMHGAAIVAVSVLLFGIPVAFILDGASPAVIYAVGLIPYIYWPMALTAAGLSGSLMTLFNPIAIGRGIWAGGLPYLVVVAFGFFAYVALGAVMVVAVAAGPVPALISVVLLAFSVGYIAGVQGYMMGCIVGSRPDGFKQLVG